MKKICLLIVMICTGYAASAYRIEYGNNITISQPVYEDLYIAGGSVTINAPVYGDLVIAGGTVSINDTVTNDILLAGGTVNFNGFVGDDIRCAGGNLTISKNVTGDVVIAGGTVVIEKLVTIGGLITSGGDITVNGNINGAVKAAFGNFTLNGNAAKEVDCRGGKITINGTVDGNAVLAATDIIIGIDAAFKNNVRYWNNKGALDFKQSLKNGKASFDPSLRISNGQWYYLGAATVMGLLWYLGMVLLLIIIVQYLFSNTMMRAANTVFDNTLKSLGLGLLFFIVVPVAAVVAFVTIIGVPVGLLLVIGYIILALMANIITSIVAANWFNNRKNYKWHYWHIVLVAFAIFILLKIISLTPFAGWLVMAVTVAIAFGSILLNINFTSKRKLLVMNQADDAIAAPVKKDK